MITAKSMSPPSSTRTHTHIYKNKQQFSTLMLCTIFLSQLLCCIISRYNLDRRAWLRKADLPSWAEQPNVINYLASVHFHIKKIISLNEHPPNKAPILPLVKRGLKFAFFIFLKEGKCLLPLPHLVSTHLGEVFMERVIMALQSDFTKYPERERKKKMKRHNWRKVSDGEMRHLSQPDENYYGIMRLCTPITPAFVSEPLQTTG